MVIWDRFTPFNPLGRARKVSIMATVKLDGQAVRTSGELPDVGSRAPDFRLVNSALEDVTLADFTGKKKVLSIVASLDTGVCAVSTRKFNERVAGREDVEILVVSSDLPFAQTRFCTTEGLEGVTTLSQLRSRHFAKDYGVLLTEGPFEGLSARAVVVLDENDRVVYTQLVGEIGDEPDYDAAFAAID